MFLSVTKNITYPRSFYGVFLSVSSPEDPRIDGNIGEIFTRVLCTAGLNSVLPMENAGRLHRGENNLFK